MKATIKNLMDKLITHNRDAVGDFGSRVVLHIPVGFLIGLFFPLSFPLLWLFIRYEASEDKWVRDEAWKDYAGAIVGAVAGLLTEVALIIYAVIKVVSLWI